MANATLSTSLPLAAEAQPPAVRPLLAAGTLCQRELVRFVRQRNRVFGALGQPIIFWLLFSAGLGPSFRMPSPAVNGAAAVNDAAAVSSSAAATTFGQFFFPGTLVLIVLFTAIFATISIIEDRREGFLQGVLVAPIPRWSMVLGKVLGGALIALLQAVIFLLLGLAIGFQLDALTLLAMIGWLFVISLALTSLGFVIAWRMDSTQGFHAIMSVFLLPMWLLSGAFFPQSSGWLGWLVRLNPLTYGVAGLRRLLYWHAADDIRVAALPDGLPSLALCTAVTMLFALLMFAAAWKISAGRTTGDLL